MTNLNFFLLIISTLFIFRCSTNNVLQADYKGNDGIILENSGDISNFKFDRYKLNNMEVTGDSLIITVSYSGGCREHIFALIAKSYFGDSSTPKAELVLSHDNKLDPCEAYPTEDQVFNLLPLKYEYIKIFGNESGKISLILDEKEVMYKL